jgi:hypothetical protein
MNCFTPPPPITDLTRRAADAFVRAYSQTREEHEKAVAAIYAAWQAERDAKAKAKERKP